MTLSALPISACAAPAIRDDVLHVGKDPDRDVVLDMSQDDPAALLGIPSPRDVDVSRALAPGQILVDQSRFRIRYVHEPGRAIEYPVALGAAGLEFQGEAIVGRKATWPSWRPTDDMIARNPEHYARYADGVPGGPDNPLGARALYLYRDGRDTYYRIHGTDNPGSIGKAVSNGCIRMLNAHVIDLYDRVPVGTRVRTV